MSAPVLDRAKLAGGYRIMAPIYERISNDANEPRDRRDWCANKALEDAYVAGLIEADMKAHP